MSKSAEANGMTEKEYRTAIHACWAQASSQLRVLHDEEFHELLADRYKSMNLIVSKRLSRTFRKQAEYARALLIVEEMQDRTDS